MTEAYSAVVMGDVGAASRKTAHARGTMGFMGRSRTWLAMWVLVAVTLGGGCSSADDEAGMTSDQSDAAPEDVAQTVGEEVAACLNEGGWDVDYQPADDSISFTGSTTQYRAYRKASDACRAQHDGPRRSLSDVSEDEWRGLYDEETATAECLRQSSVSVPEIPSYQTYVERYLAEDPWLAYDSVGEVSSDRWTELNTDCPQPGL